MKRFDGKTAWWLYLLLVLYNLMPIGIVVFDKTFEWNIPFIIGFVCCYLFNIVWLPIMIIDWVDVYDDYFVFHYGYLKENLNKQLMYYNIIELNHEMLWNY